MYGGQSDGTTAKGKLSRSYLRKGNSIQKETIYHLVSMYIADTLIEPNIIKFIIMENFHYYFSTFTTVIVIYSL